MKGKVNIEKERVVGEGPLIGSSYRFNPARPHPDQARYCVRGSVPLAKPVPENVSRTENQKTTQNGKSMPPDPEIPNKETRAPVTPEKEIEQISDKNELIELLLKQISKNSSQKGMNQSKKKKKSKTNRRFNPEIEKDEETWHNRFGH